MITLKDCESGRDPLLEALAKPSQARGIYVRNNATSLADRMTRERIEHETEEKRTYDAKVASGEIQLDLHGQQIVAPESKFVFMNEGKDVLGDLVKSGS